MALSFEESTFYNSRFEKESFKNVIKDYMRRFIKIFKAIKL